MTSILWHSQAPWVAGGYGNQTALFTPRLAKAGHDVAISAYFGLRGSALDWHGVPVWPAGAEDHSNDTIGPYAAAHVGQDGLMLTLLDVFVLRSMALTQHRTAAWLPIDHDPAPPELVDARLRELGMAPIAMSRFGQRVLQDAGHSPYYVPHGVDTSTYTPQDRSQARQLLGVGESTFVVGMVAANVGTSPPRKAFPEALSAFKAFHEQHPDSVLYLHTDVLGGGERTGMDLLRYSQEIGLPQGSVCAVNQHQYRLGLPASTMALAYSGMDVLLNPSYCEGFGIPLVEAQACGTPVVVNSFSSMPELVGAGWQADGERIWHEGAGSWFQRPSVDSIAACLEQAYTHAPGMREQAREFALEYDADRVFDEYLLPTIDKLNQEL